MAQQQPLSVDPNAATLEDAAPRPLSTDPGAAVLSAATPPPTADPSAGSRFLSGFGRTNPVSAVGGLAYGLMTDPKGTANQTLFQPIAQRAQQALDDYHSGRPAAALGHAAAGIPFIGPAVAGPIERAQSGDVAGALGEATGTAMTLGLLKPSTVVGTAAEAARAVPGVSTALDAGADLVEGSAAKRLGDTLAPEGTSKSALRMRSQATRVAPDLLQDPTLSSWTTGGFRRALGDRLEQVKGELDDAQEARVGSQSYPTAPVIQQLQNAQQQWTAEAVEASRATPEVTERQSPILDESGRPMTVTSTQAVPYGQSVIPQPNAPAAGQIANAIRDIRALGPTATYEALRTIRDAYDETAKQRYTPSVNADYQRARGEGNGAAAVTGVIRQQLAAIDPQSALAYRHYHVYQSAAEVMDAAAELERGQPSAGRTAAVRGLGSLLGMREGGLTGAITGGLLAPAFDAALSGGPTAQIKISYALAGLARAMRGGNPSIIDAAIQAVQQATPMRTSVRIAATGVAASPPPSPALAQQQKPKQQAASPPPVAPEAVTAVPPPPR